MNRVQGDLFSEDRTGDMVVLRKKLRKNLAAGGTGRVSATTNVMIL